MLFVKRDNVTKKLLIGYEHNLFSVDLKGIQYFSSTAIKIPQYYQTKKLEQS